MKLLLNLAWRSAWNRRWTLGLTMVAIALSVMLLLGIERLRQDVRNSFAQSVSGVDLIVGARGSGLQLLLFSVFRIGDAVPSLDWASAQRIAGHRAVRWAVPLSLGDSHRGLPVLGTTVDYFEHFRYGDARALALAEGRAFRAGREGLFEVVVGAEVAQALGYRLGDSITLAHGIGAATITEHADKPFTIVGMLARTGTPVDRTLHINLESMEAIHLDWQAGAPVPGMTIAPEHVTKFDLEPKAVTAVLVGLKQRTMVFAMQRFVQEFDEEPLMAVLPGVQLHQLWSMLGNIERALLLVSAMVMVAGLAGMTATMLAGLNERRRELAILRSVGAGPQHVMWLLALEGFLVTAGGMALGLLLLQGGLMLGAPLLEGRYGLVLGTGLPDAAQWRLLGAVGLAGALSSLLPGWRAYRASLADGLSLRV